MPKHGLTMREGTVIKWLKKEGEEVKAGEEVVEIFTGKVNIMITAANEGILKKILVNEGCVAEVGTPIGIIEDIN
ncbi:Dihydrolipoyllysine-residue acetyltransferase component of pyruvate dehydrogenase complex [Thermovenabulum gondwanense]|uniref:Dihydrolipoyllysine-residue acetyltransferase component of pyruvate dehydrogenase complex n=2 Tax=Thermovenabulum gondwanense TaxID=520767 RepID=A0A161QCJ5_9FIRM|nr:Dihydrolipoyllysine-residue acetyltransferase component of pyruvate dehydrogenase complex [Thermovenabulum gondwanense]